MESKFLKETRVVTPEGTGFAVQVYSNGMISVELDRGDTLEFDDNAVKFIS
jgi:hypothetical protein